MRDTAEGKTSFELISPHLLLEWPAIEVEAQRVCGLIEGSCLEQDRAQRYANIWQYVQGFRASCDYSFLVKAAAWTVSLLRDPDTMGDDALARLSRWCKLGAARYSARNWEQGMPFSRVVDSLCRHVRKLITGDESEDHVAAVLWNIMALLHYRSECQNGGLPPELDDLPRYGAARRRPNQEVPPCAEG